MKDVNNRENSTGNLETVPSLQLYWTSKTTIKIRIYFKKKWWVASGEFQEREEGEGSAACSEIEDVQEALLLGERCEDGSSFAENLTFSGPATGIEAKTHALYI